MFMSVIEKKMKKKIVEFIGRIQDGGAESLVKDYALMLDKDLFDVTILCEDYRKESSNYKTLISNGVKIETMYEKSFFINKVLARIFGKRYVSLLFRKAINKLKPDVLHCHLEVLEILYYAKDCLDGIKLLFTCHNPPEMLIGSGNPRERDACRYLIDNNNLQIIALHEDMAKEINTMFNVDNTAVIRNGIDFNRFKNIKKTKSEIKKELGIPEDSYIIGQVGRFTYQKNQEFSISLMPSVLNKKDNAYLLLIGRGNKDLINKEINSLGIKDRVLILEGRDDIPELLKAMDVFIFPSRFEGLGIVLIEAQVAGLPCVTSDQVPLEAYQTSNITRLSLDDDLNVWADALVNPVGNIKSHGNLNNYDMSKEIKNLEKLYL